MQVPATSGTLTAIHILFLVVIEILTPSASVFPRPPQQQQVPVRSGEGAC
jgi:hypothetical protein